MEGAYIVVYELGGLTSVNALVGTMATPFGTFASRSFATVNPLIGMSLIYHYFSAVRGACVRRDNADQLSRRAQPTLYDACWNTGLPLWLIRAGYVRFGDDLRRRLQPYCHGQRRPEYVGRLGLQPTIALKFGESGAYGPLT